MITNSVDIVRQLNLIRENRRFFHETNDGVLCKVLKYGSISVLKDVSLKSDLEKYYVLNKQYEFLNSKGETQVKTYGGELALFKGLLKEHLDEFNYIIDYNNGKVNPSDSKVRELKSLLKSNIDKIEIAKDISDEFKVIVVDDGLNRHSLLINNNEQFNEIEPNDTLIVSVDAIEDYTFEKGYIITSNDGILEYRLKSFDKVLK